MRRTTPLRMHVQLTNWDGRRTAGYFFVYLAALIAVTVFLTPELIDDASYGYLQIGAAALLTWFTRRRALRVRTGPRSAKGYGDSLSRKGRLRTPESGSIGKDPDGPTLH
ncbi:MAG: hypothetical protein HY788_05335 [Deltaproteobacteria bacterium]|nr:hypothetical protein [Deltaproteobacteria bacterium]